MNAHDWALIAFTILVQMSVGSMWVLLIARLYANRKYGVEAADRLSDRALLALVVVVVLAFAASLFHLGDPFNAYRAVINVGTSWLSREILFGVTFALLAVVYALMQWRKIGSIGLRNVIAWLAALVGLVLVYCMARVYMVQSQPAWNSWATMVSFFTTAFLLGALAMGVAFVANYSYMQTKQPGCADEQCILMRETLRWVALAALILLGVELVVLPIYLVALASGSATGLASVKLMAGSYGWMLALRVLLVFLGAGVFGLFLYQNTMSVGKEKAVQSMAYLAFLVVLAAEVLGRVLFYVSHVRLGI